MPTPLPNHFDAVRDSVVDGVALQSRCAGAMQEHLRSNELAAYPSAHALIDRASLCLTDCASQFNDELVSLPSAVVASSAEALDAEPAGHGTSALASSRSWPTSKMLGENYVALSAVAVSLSMIHALATARRADTVANVAERQLSQIATLVVSVSREIPRVVVAESARREPLGASPNAAERSLDVIQAAWRRA